MARRNSPPPKKYELLEYGERYSRPLTPELGVTLRRIRYTWGVYSKRGKEIVAPGTLGGYIQSEKNLDQQGTCVILEGGQAMEEAFVSGSAIVRGIVRERAQITGKSRIGKRVEVGGAAKIKSSRLKGLILANGTAQLIGCRISARFFPMTFNKAIHRNDRHRQRNPHKAALGKS